MAMMAAVMDPPIATLCAIAKRLPAATEPIAACQQAARVPTLVMCEQVRALAWSMRLTSDGPSNAKTDHAKDEDHRRDQKDARDSTGSGHKRGQNDARNSNCSAKG
jgi:hypothetical protein